MSGWSERAISTLKGPDVVCTVRTQGQGAVDDAIRSLSAETIQWLAGMADTAFTNDEVGADWLRGIVDRWDELYQQSLPATEDTQRLG